MSSVGVGIDPICIDLVFPVAQFLSNICEKILNGKSYGIIMQFASLLLYPVEQLCSCNVITAKCFNFTVTVK